MATPRPFRLALEVVLGLAPATFLLVPMLMAATFGTGFAAFAAGSLDQPTALLIAWALAGVVGIAALWVVVLCDGPVGLRPTARPVLTIGMLLGMAAAVRWLWWMFARGHMTDPAGWAVWLVLLGGPLVVAGLRLAQMWGSRRRT